MAPNAAIIGYGEVGEALFKMYSGVYYNVYTYDKEPQPLEENIKILNICFPYSDSFVESVVDYIGRTNAHLTIIHSTVLPGTTRTIQQKVKNAYVVHSPVRGNHRSDLTRALPVFEKYIGSDTEQGAILAETHFNELGITSSRFKDSLSTEFAKLLCTSFYGVCIAWHDRISKLCLEHDLDFDDVVSDWNLTYNIGYAALAGGQYTRPILYPPQGEIGGHCVVPNAKLLKQIWDSPFLDEILNTK